MGKWKTYTIDEIGKVVTGRTPNPSIDAYYGGDVPFLTPSDDMDSKYVLHTKKTLTDAGCKSVSTIVVPTGSICVSCIGSNLGKVTITTEATVTNQQINTVVIDTDRFDVDFIYYAILRLGETIREQGKVCTAIPNINKTEFSSHAIKCPNLKIQKRIGRALAAIDEKISTNRHINENLLAQAQTFYVHYCTPQAADNQPLPEGYTPGVLGDIIEIHDAQRKPIPRNIRCTLDKVYPYYGAVSCVDYVDDYIFDGEYVLLGEDGTVLDDDGHAILQYVTGKFWVNNHAHIITGKNGFNTQIAYVLLSLTKVSSSVTGAVQPKITQKNLKKIPIVIPSDRTLQLCEKTFKPLFTEVQTLRAENDRLVKMRDSLADMLMSHQYMLDDKSYADKS